MKNLVIDIGNTRLKWAFFYDTDMVDHGALSSYDEAQILNLVIQKKPQHIIISTVTAEFSNQLIVELQKKCDLLIQLDAKTPLPIHNLYRTPHTLGKDRLAAVVGAAALYPSEATLVIDAGTCLKLDFINAKSEFIGGNISPGVDMRLRAMHEFTARLPLVDNKEIHQLLGNDTETALINGGLQGVFCEIMGFIALMKINLNSPSRIILTGGDGENIFNLIKNIYPDVVHFPSLVLHGLNKILVYNVSL